MKYEKIVKKAIAEVKEKFPITPFQFIPKNEDEIDNKTREKIKPLFKKTHP